MSKISVIVPIYKVEPYIRRCVDSILSQTHRDLEVILVDDGSPDNCGAICEEYAAKDERVRVIHKQNGGLSSARNAGLAVATGAYVGFVDSDDDVLPDMYAHLCAVIEREQVDFVMSDYWRVPTQGESYLKTTDMSAGRYDKKQLMQEIFPVLIMREEIDYGPLLSVCHCLYDRRFLQEHRLCFDEQVRWSEDNLFSAMLGYQATSFYYDKGFAGYRYHQNADSITTGYNPGAWQVYSLMNERMHTFFDQVSDYDFSRQLKLHMIYYACVCINKSTVLPKKQALAEIREILHAPQLRAAFTGFPLPQVSWKLKLQLWLIKRHCAKVLYYVMK